MPDTVSQVLSSRSILGENPLWDDGSGQLLSIDCMGRKLLRHDMDRGEVVECALLRTPGSVALRTDGNGLLMANRQGLALADTRGAITAEISTSGIDFGKEVFNDGKCDSRGRFWVGTMDRDVQSPVGGLYRVDTDRRVTRMDGGITLANGIAWSPDERTLYVCDSRPGRVWAYDYDLATGEIAGRRLHIDFNGRSGRPDGCTTDAEGGLWIAEIGAGQVVRFDPAGNEISVVKMPVSKPTSVTFGGSDLQTLFVTSMRYGLAEVELAREPLAGCVFAINPGIAGLAAARFGG